MAEIVITKENFDTAVLQAELSVLIDFGATWCGPCRMLAPIIEQIAADRADTLTVGTVDVDEQPELAVRFGIESVPTVLLFRNGALTARTVGYQPRESLEKQLGLSD